MYDFIGINKNIYEFIEKSKKNDLIDILSESSKLYYNSDYESNYLTDKNFDLIREYLKEKYNYEYLEIGYSVCNKKNKVELPHFMPSIKKVKGNNEDLEKWLKKFDEKYFVITDKLDGMSLLLYKRNNKIHANTRGNGVIGQDISPIVKYLNIGKVEEKSFIRGELIISKKIGKY